MANIIGIDPGDNGAMVLSYPDGTLNVFRFKDATQHDIANALWEWVPKDNDTDCFAFIEKAHSFPGQGVASMFKFGTSYGFLLGCLTALKFPFDYVSPQKWQKELGCLSKGNKNITKAKAQELFPNLKITHADADALLIAEYGRRMKQKY